MAKLSNWHHRYIRLVESGIWANEHLFFYPKLRSFYRKLNLPKSPVILDVGANKGQSIRFFKSIFPPATIHAFEPNEKVFKILQQNCMADEIHLHPIAVSDHCGETTFYESIIDETSSLEVALVSSDYMKFKSKILLTRPENMVAAEYTVPVISLDAFITEHQLEQVDLVKIDVEGHEPGVLRGMEQSLRNNFIKYIQIEEHSNDQYAHARTTCRQLLAQAGFSEIFRVKHGFGNFYEVIYANTALIGRPDLSVQYNK